MKHILLFFSLITIFQISFGQVGDSLIFVDKTYDYIWADSISKTRVNKPPQDGTKVLVVQVSKDRYKISFDARPGWTMKINVLRLEEYKALLTAQRQARLKAEQTRIQAEQARLKAEQEQKKAKEKAQAEALAKRRVELTTRYQSQAIVDKIIAKQIWLGMTAQMARDSRGVPSSINKTVNASGVHEQWVYYNTYLYFDNGVLTSWQE
jgi:hypothetical protein